MNRKCDKQELTRGIKVKVTMTVETSFTLPGAIAVQATTLQAYKNEGAGGTGPSANPRGNRVQRSRRIARKIARVAGSVASRRVASLLPGHPGFAIHRASESVTAS